MTRARIFFSILAASLAFLMVVISIGSVAYASDDYEKEVEQEVKESVESQVEEVTEAKEAEQERYKKKLELAKKMVESIKKKTNQAEETKEEVEKENKEQKYKELNEMGKQYGLNQDEDEYESEKRGANADKALEMACNRVRERYQERLERYKQAEERYVTGYGKAISYLEGALTKLESLGVDTTEAREAFATFKEKIDEAVASLRQSMNLLEDLKEMNCSEPEKARNQLQMAREELKQAREKAKEARRFYKEELRPILLNLKG